MSSRGLHLYTHPACLAHAPGSDHVELPARLRRVIDALRAGHPDLPWHKAPAATRTQLRRVHQDSLLRLVLDGDPSPEALPTLLDPDTHLGPGSAAAALHAAGAGIAAVDALMSGNARRAFCAVRPPGHHATADGAMGFCLLNNVAVAAAHARDQHGLTRVAVVDFDVHHGNGTEAIFEHDERVMYLSSHQWPLFPDTGAAEERGVGNVVNEPLRPGTDGRCFRQAWADRLLPALDSFRPQLLLVSAGFDGDRRDPLADLELEVADFRWLTCELVAIADRHADGRLVSTLEGGYDLTALSEGVVAHVDALR